ncbi:MAG: TOBE domain-containing protein [Vicinamibacterales bacterium]
MTLGVRAEAIELSTEPREGWIKARVGVVESLGNETLVTIELPSGRVVARGPGAFAVDADAPIWFTAAPEALAFFESASGAGKRVD